MKLNKLNITKLVLIISVVIMEISIAISCANVIIDYINEFVLQISIVLPLSLLINKIALRLIKTILEAEERIL